MTRHPNDIPSSGASPPSRQDLLAWIEGFLRTLPRQSRHHLDPASAFVEPVEGALEQGQREGEARVGNPRAFVEEHMRGVAFKQLLDPDRPLDDPWVIAQAAELCAEVLRSRDRVHRRRHGELVDVAAAEAIGWLSLLELSKRLWSGEQIRNPSAYLRVIIEADVQRLIDASMRQAYPGNYALRRLGKREEKRLRQERPDLEVLERRALAVTLAREAMGRDCRFLDRVAEGALDAIVDDRAGVSKRVLSDGMVEEGDRLVEDPSRYTPTDRDTWERFKVAGFRGADIDWAGTCSRHTGSQRVQALCRKLRGDLGDWR